VEDLAPGDLLLTRDRGFQPLLWRGMRRSRIPASGSDAAPVLINADALGNGQPERDLIVSPCHRLLSTDPELLAGTGEPEVLLEARTLAGRPGIGRICRDVVTYVHLLMAQHEVILAENAWSESFLLTPASAEALTVSGCGVSRDVLQGLRPGGQIPARLCPAALDMKAPVQA